jgi:hypothetical protein
MMEHEQQPTAPIVAGEPSNLCFFGSANDAARYFEPPEVRDGSLVTCDSEGRKLCLAVEPEVRAGGFLWWRWTTTIERVVLRIFPDAPPTPDELATLLRDWLARLGDPLPSPETTQLPQLLLRSIARSGFTR